mmetsp:Transcript_67950/g.107767  ORF Transcript_67950/g.107767 Transcript_67950/m.107767 type:complete len:151 (+) Transcript_67950:67-519(+)|eukprot:CAMPEP_0169072294 /NCGR_PEP_ID=MMETSP1015-20121227/6118_1 /TAXON_ID=342587 /ORGANISM="Karlodinium micrum, Strain CCMP2283" /LENGTH=150 /DNA_ID=CAMNT_0009131441 /DNA_START=62 /DNA_END=514 /DNA_ORIENTATION=+
MASQKEKTSRLEGKAYKDHVDDLMGATAIKEGDFDVKAIALLDVLHEQGKAGDACQFLKTTLEGRERDRVANWRAYVYTLLRGFDKDAYDAVKGGADNSNNRRNRGDRKKKPLPFSDFSFRADAPVFVPGVPTWGASTGTAEEKDTTATP